MNWVKVDNELPENGCRVLTLGPKGKIQVCMFENRGSFVQPCFWTDRWTRAQVIYWMKLPPFPDEFN